MSRRAPSRRAPAVVADRRAIRDTVDNWVLWRDSGDWERFATVWHPDGWMTATWFQGPAKDFIEVSRQGFNRGVMILHTLGGWTCDVAGHRAISQTRMTINQRAPIDGVLVDVVCMGRFYDFFEKRKGRWAIVRRQPIYEQDRLDPVDPSAVLSLDPTLLARFPEGYGVKLAKGEHLMSIVAFYHKAPITKDVMATFTMYMAPEGAPVKEMDVYQVGINIVCFSKFSQRGPDQTDEGIEIKPGVQVHSAPLKFSMDGCVKFAYPHGHDELLMIALDNKTTKQTLLRTVPDVSLDGTFREFLSHQVYQDSQGFPVTKADDYEMIMVHHHPLQKQEAQHGMGNYLLYMTPGACPTTPNTPLAK